MSQSISSDFLERKVHGEGNFGSQKVVVVIIDQAAF